VILVGLTPDQIGQAVTEAQRPNGSLNVHLLVRYADWLVRQAHATGGRRTTTSGRGLTKRRA
jgi:hypothetical protein